MTRLSVNLNKVALLRNARHTGVPDILHFARLAHQAGADGVTVHPRPDERHIRRADVYAIAETIAGWRPAFQYNIEGYPDDRLLDIIRDIEPEQCTLVPDSPDTFTSDEGWRLDEAQVDIVAPAIAQLRAHGTRPILFIDPDDRVIPRVKLTGAAGIEIYTGRYADAFRRGDSQATLDACAAAGEAANRAGLIVNIGHDLNLKNLAGLMPALPFVAEASIGHELTADALEMGFVAAIQSYRRALNR